MALPAYKLQEKHEYLQSRTYNNIYSLDTDRQAKLEIVQAGPMIFRFIPADMQRELRSFEKEYLNRLNKKLASRLQTSSSLFVGDIIQNDVVYIQSHSFSFSESMQITNILIESIVWVGNQADRELRSKI